MNQKSLFEGYPFGTPKSLELFPKSERPVGQQIDAAVKEGVLMTGEIISRYSVALHEAEQQIVDMQIIYPFLPEDYGFECLELSEEDELKFAPKNKYVSKDENIQLERIYDHVWRIKIHSRAIPDPKHPDEYIFTESNFDGLVHIESEQEMYQFFKMMGVTKSIQPIISQLPEGSEKIGAPIDIQLNNGAKIQSIEELRPKELIEEEKPFTA